MALAPEAKCQRWRQDADAGVERAEGGKVERQLVLRGRVEEHEEELGQLLGLPQRADRARGGRRSSREAG
eukprot:1702262-Pyramimonas_sp.AAC.1